MGESQEAPKKVERFEEGPESVLQAELRGLEEQIEPRILREVLDPRDVEEQISKIHDAQTLETLKDIIDRRILIQQGRQKGGGSSALTRDAISGLERCREAVDKAYDERFGHL